LTAPPTGTTGFFTANAGSMENRFKFDLATVNVDTKDF
jgi:hypothetical protein